MDGRPTWADKYPLFNILLTLLIGVTFIYIFFFLKNVLLFKITQRHPITTANEGEDMSSVRPYVSLELHQKIILHKFKAYSYLFTVFLLTTLD